MKIRTIPPRDFAANTYCIISGKKSYIVDPAAPVETVAAVLAEEGATPVGILLTHGHFDHLLSLEECRGRWQIPVFIHGLDADALTDPVRNVNKLFLGVPRVWCPAERTIDDGDDLCLEGEAVVPIHTPGHTPGSVCLLCGHDLITGDTLFDGGVGRCDLPGGDDDELANSLTSLTELDPALTIYPGHGGSTTLGAALRQLGFFVE